MKRTFVRLEDTPNQSQANIVGEVFDVSAYPYCALCKRQMRLVTSPFGFKCQNPECDQFPYVYEPEKMFLRRVT